MKRTLLAAAVFALAAFCASAAPDFRSDPAAFQTEAYIRVMQADQALDEGDDATARAYYAEGLDLFRELAKSYPGWEPRIIAYRIAYCEDKLDALADAPRVWTEDAAGAVAAADVPTAPAVAAPSAPARPATVPADNDAASALSRAKADRAEALARAHAAEQELSAVRSRGDEAAGTLQALEARLAKEREEARAALEAKDAEIARCTAEKVAAERGKEEAEAETAKLARRYESLEKSLEETAGELEAAREEIARLSKALGEAELAEAKAREEIALLSQDLSEAEARLAAGETVAENPQAAAAETPLAPAAGIVPAAKTTVEVLLAQGKNSAALAAARAALKEMPSDRSLRELEGFALLRLKRYTEAMGVLVPLAEENRGDAAIHSALGAAFMGARYTDEARDAYEVAVKIDPKRRDAHFNLAQLYAFSEPKNLRKARKHYEKAKELGLPPSPRLDAALD